MQKELAAASELLTRQLGIRPQEKAKAFRSALEDILSQRYQDHWHPTLHSAYRAITILPGHLDAAVVEALHASGTPVAPVLAHLRPNFELVVWVDPGEVAYKVGGDQSAIVIVYSDR
ncbi:MAG: hypothetical protein DHS80DRAFT_855, partial [Piptocephalis tieghemiana]